MLQKDILIFEDESIRYALKKLDKTAEKVLLVVNEESRLLGTITDGDIRRYILKSESLEDDIREVYNKDPVYIRKKDFSTDLAKKMLIENKIELLPVLDESDKVIDFTIWSWMFSSEEMPVAKRSKISIPAVIMAGGKGTRLEPFTKILPKSLIPVGDKPIIEIIIDEFKKHGISKYFLMLNYKSAMIEAYFNNTERDYEIEYIKENDFLGTAGSLKLLEEKISDVFIVSNSDVIVKANFEDVVNFHKEQQASLTILSSIRHYKIPYGIIKIKKGGEVVDILEKPEYTFTINAGIYVLNRESLQFISKEAHFDMTDLIKTLIDNNKKVMMYPVNENDYIDIGQWEEYKKAVDSLQLLR